VRHGDSAASRKFVTELSGVVRLEDVNGVRGDVRGHVALALILRLRRSVNVHHQMPDGASGPELDLSVPATNSRKSIDSVDDDFISLASYALDGDGVVPESGEETVLLLRTTGTACDGHQQDHGESAETSEV